MAQANDHIEDGRLGELIRQAYQNDHLLIEAREITQIRRRRPARWVTVSALGVLVAVVLVGTAVVGKSILGEPGGSARPVMPGTAGPTAQPGPSISPGGKVRPSSTATTPVGRCTDYAMFELAAAGLSTQERWQMPPLRFQRTVVKGEVDLLLFASDTAQVACWITPSGVTTSVNASMMDTGDATHPAGTLSYSSGASGLDPMAAFAFGRVPKGVNKVKIFYPDNSSTTAVLANGWYVVTASGAAGHRLAEVTKVVGYAPGQEYTTPVYHG